MSTIDEICDMFDTESQKLENTITNAESKSDLSLSEIIDTYYQVMNVSSMISMLQEHCNAENNSKLLEKICETKKIISNKFNLEIHPKILLYLVTSIQHVTKSLQSNSGNKSKEEIKNESNLYDDLRKKMSTKEFIEQYAAGLK